MGKNGTHIWDYGMTIPDFGPFGEGNYQVKCALVDRQQGAAGSDDATERAALAVRESAG